MPRSACSLFFSLACTLFLNLECACAPTTLAESPTGGDSAPGQITMVLTLRRNSVLCTGAALLLLTGIVVVSDVTPADADTPSRRTPIPRTDRVPRAAVARDDLLNGVIVVLFGGRRVQIDYFFRHNLPRLDRYFLRCWPYPVRIFHEAINESDRSAINAALPSLKNGADFEDVSHIWKSSPPGISEKQVQELMASGEPRGGGRGYRMMCRFWAGLLWELKSMQRYDYYWRLDTDSAIRKPVPVDLFRHLFAPPPSSPPGASSRNAVVPASSPPCEYAYTHLTRDSAMVTQGLLENFKAWAAAAIADGTMTQARLDAVMRFQGIVHAPLPASVEVALRSLEVNATAPGVPPNVMPMFFNNFELGTVALRRTPVFRSFFRYTDEQPPHGFIKFRWGDAPWTTLAVVAALGGGTRDHRVCHVPGDLVRYNHANFDVPPVVDADPVCTRAPL